MQLSLQRKGCALRRSELTYTQLISALKTLEYADGAGIELQSVQLAATIRKSLGLPPAPPPSLGHRPPQLAKHV